MKIRVWLKRDEKMKDLSLKEYYKEKFKQVVEEIKDNYQKLSYPL